MRGLAERISPGKTSSFLAITERSESARKILAKARPLTSVDRRKLELKDRVRVREIRDGEEGKRRSRSGRESSRPIYTIYSRRRGSAILGASLHERRANGKAKGRPGLILPEPCKTGATWNEKVEKMKEKGRIEIKIKINRVSRLPARSISGVSRREFNQVILRTWLSESRGTGLCAKAASRYQRG